MRAPERAQKAPDPLWVWAERAGQADDSRRQALDDEAQARLKLARQAAGNFAARLPSVDEWAAFMRSEIVPVYNAVMPHDRMCLECGKRMGEKKATTHVCSPECASRFEARRRPRGSSAAAATVAAVRPQAPADTTKITLGEVAAIGREKKRR